MSERRRVAVRIAAAGVPAGLKALHVERASVGPDGRPQLRGPGPSGPRVLVLAAERPTGKLDDRATHGLVRKALTQESRRRSALDELASDELALTLTHAGLVRMTVPAATEDGVVTVGAWRTWDRTPDGERWAATYRSVDRRDPVVAHAVAHADATSEGDADTWAATVALEVARVGALCERATALVDDGEAHGWTLARFAEEVADDPGALDEGAPLASLILGHVARHLGIRDAPTTPVDRAALLAAIGIGASALSATVASVRVPGGGGAVGALLTAAAGHDVPLLLQRTLVADGGGRPVAPPRSVGWVFAVQHQSTFATAADLPVRTPIVLHGGSPAALGLLRHCVNAGWRVAVAADDDEAGRKRQGWLLDRLGDAAVAWGVREGDTAARGETSHIDTLLADIRAGRPS